MSQSDKAYFYNQLKSAGVKFDKHYRDYSTDELKVAFDRLAESGALPPAEPQPVTPEPQFDPAATAAALAAAAEAPDPQPKLQARIDEDLRQRAQANHPAGRRLRQPPAPQAPRDPNEMPGQRLNSQGDEPIRVDEQGLIWYQEEVRKPSYPKPRGRRVLKYMETGTKVERVQTGEYVEEFEVAGDQPSRPAEVKITLPSYQVGIYKDPRFPFRIHIYNENRGFDLFEVQNYYGGSELVPAEIKRVYVENVLCYDIRTTVRAIQTEYRQLQLQNRV